MFAEHVDHPRDSMGIVVNSLDGFVRKDLIAVRSGHAKPLGDVALGFLQRKRARAAAHSNPLPKLP
jgi:hypothetical protein